MGKRWKVYRKKDERHRSKPDLDALEEEYIRRAEEMEKELFADEDFVDYEPTDEQERESYARLIQRLKDDGIYCEDDDVERKHAAGMENLRKAAGGRRKMYFAKAGKVAGVAILCCACVFAASMTSEANRTYLVNNIRVWSGVDTKTVVDNDESNEVASGQEESAIVDIENKLNVDMPEFFYRPQGLEFFNYEIDEYVAIARVEYQYKENIITLLISKENENIASNINSMRGNVMEKIVYGDEGITISVKQMEDAKDKTQTCVAEWKMNSVAYHLAGKIEIEELIKMVEQMKF